MAEAVPAHSDPVVVRLVALRRVDDEIHDSKAEVNPGVAQVAVEPKKVVDMLDLTLELNVLTCWHHHSVHCLWISLA
ncbi:hypothetical protein KXV22_000924 [Aspergillus fumigatus]|nr:hypothetical protein KXV80_001893 [Aspergillus fumigatus]KAH3573992.1 hypothetical protein KXV22_000924 [Aspergillus fumigatus]